MQKVKLTTERPTWRVLECLLPAV